MSDTGMAALVTALVTGVVALATGLAKVYRMYRSAKADADAADQKVRESADFNASQHYERIAKRQESEIVRLNELIEDLQVRVQYLYEDAMECQSDVSDCYAHMHVMHSCLRRQAALLKTKGLESEEVPDMPVRKPRKPPPMEAGFQRRNAAQAVTLTREVTSRLREMDDGTVSGPDGDTLPPGSQPPPPPAKPSP